MPVPLPMTPVSGAPRCPTPRFVVGQDPEGHWVALEVHGQGGGLFRTRHDALRYATTLTDRRPEAVVIATDRVAFRI